MILFLLLLFSPGAHAAQSAQVIVPTAKIYLYPQVTSNVVGSVNKGQAITISSLPTEGFFKTRAPNGEIGWISGNDVLAGPGASPAVPSGYAASGVNPNVNTRRRGPSRRLRNEEVPAGQEGFRFLIGYGISNSSYTGLTTAYDQVSLGTGKDLGFEAQFRINKDVYWAIRVQTISATTGSTNYDASTTQQVDIKEIPVEVGIMWSPVTSRKFRLGFGGYLGGVPSASAKITQTTSAGQVKSVEYSTTEICAEIAAQATVGLSDAFAIFLDLSYRYDQTGTTPDTTAIKTVPGFKINYSGVAVRGGLEIRL